MFSDPSCLSLSTSCVSQYPDERVVQLSYDQPLYNFHFDFSLSIFIFVFLFLVQEMVERPYETRSDSFYFVDNKLIMHNKAEYAYDG